jgi:hypothetical protein
VRPQRTRKKAQEGEEAAEARLLSSSLPGGGGVTAPGEPTLPGVAAASDVPSADEPDSASVVAVAADTKREETNPSSESRMARAAKVLGLGPVAAAGSVEEEAADEQAEEEEEEEEETAAVKLARLAKSRADARVRHARERLAELKAEDAGELGLAAKYAKRAARAQRAIERADRGEREELREQEEAEEADKAERPLFGGTIWKPELEQVSPFVRTWCLDSCARVLVCVRGAIRLDCELEPRLLEWSDWLGRKPRRLV